MSTEPKRVELSDAERALWRMDAETSAIAEIATTKPLQRRILILLDALEEAAAREAAARREALPDVEAVSAAVHEAWMEAKRAQGVTSRPSEWGEEQMVPYADLSERAKDLDRATVRSVYAAIEEARA